MTKGHEEFICEELTTHSGAFDAGAMARGEPGLPQHFTWRGVEYRVAGVIRQWKTSSACRNGSDEMYLRRHWYQVLTEPRAVMTIYCDRQAKNRKRPKARWFVYSAELSSREHTTEVAGEAETASTQRHRGSENQTHSD